MPLYIEQHGEHTVVVCRPVRPKIGSARVYPIPAKNQYSADQDWVQDLYVFPPRSAFNFAWKRFLYGL